MPHRLIADRNRSNARRLRREMTSAESRLWTRLRAHRLSGFSFRRQVPIGSYIADFVCLEARLIIEVDGGQHNANVGDRRRDDWLAGQGFRVLRFWNNEVLSNTIGVRERITEALEPTAPPSPTLPQQKGVHARLRRAMGGASMPARGERHG